MDGLLRGIHVLLVEDDPESRELLETVLEYAGALVTPAFTARGALRALESARPDLLLCDLADDTEDAGWLLARVRRLAEGADLPAVALGGRRGHEARQRLLDAGFAEHLPKPVDPWHLCDVVAAQARRRA